jgi:hypothetical protein
MTSHDGRQVRHPRGTDEDVPLATARKAVLFCPDCGHEALVDGDWDERDDVAAGVRELRCPDCETVLTDRPLPRESLATGSDAESDGRGGLATWGTLWTTTLRFWFGVPRRKEGVRRAN